MGPQGGSKYASMFVRKSSGHLEFVEEIGDVEKEFHSRQVLSDATAFSERERHELVVLLQLSVSVDEALGFETVRLGEDLKECVIGAASVTSVFLGEVFLNECATLCLYAHDAWPA